MLRSLILAAALLLFASVVVLAQSATNAAQSKPKIRIGIYDSRAIAVAYAPSRFNPVREKMAEHAAAKAAGDQQKVKELEAWGAQHQKMLHFQGFCRVPVSDLLEPVKDRMQQLTTEMNLAAIVMSCDSVSPDVELIDVTDQIVEFYSPSDRTRQMAAEIRQTEPVSLLTIGARSDKK